MSFQYWKFHNSKYFFYIVTYQKQFQMVNMYRLWYYNIEYYGWY